MTANQLLFTLLRTKILHAPSEISLPDTLSEEELEQLYSLSQAHSLTHLAAYALSEAGLLTESELSERFRTKMLRAVLRHEQLSYETNQICDTLETAGIDHIPLKGAVIRSYYPEAWMRNSCDIDILVREDDLDEAVRVLTEKMHYTTDHKKWYHDISLYSRNGIHLELHFKIHESIDTMDSVSETVWQHSVLCDSKTHMYRQTHEFLLFHVIAHMSCHFQHGGCGIRPFMDLYILQNKLAYDRDLLLSLCESSGLSQFYQHVQLLISVWFGDGAHTEVTQMMENFILSGGVYGTLTNRVAIANQRAGSKSKQIRKRIFMPYDDLKIAYPVLKKHPTLLPFCHIARFCRLFSVKTMRRSVNELQTIQNTSPESAASAAILLDKLGL